MDTVVRIVNIIGDVALVLGLLWALIGVIHFFQSKKNQDKKGMDDGLEGLMYGGILGIVAKGICASIVASLGGIGL